MFLIYFYGQAISNGDVEKDLGACNSSITCSLFLVSLFILIFP